MNILVYMNSKTIKPVKRCFSLEVLLPLVLVNIRKRIILSHYLVNYIFYFSIKYSSLQNFALVFFLNQKLNLYCYIVIFILLAMLSSEAVVSFTEILYDKNSN